MAEHPAEDTGGDPIPDGAGDERPGPAGPAVGGGIDDPVAHLRTAATEVIRAVRSFLDIAEQVVADPRAAEAVGRVVGDLAETGRRLLAGAGSDPSPARPGVQRIPVERDDPADTPPES